MGGALFCEDIGVSISVCDGEEGAEAREERTEVGLGLRCRVNVSTSDSEYGETLLRDVFESVSSGVNGRKPEITGVALPEEDLVKGFGFKVWGLGYLKRVGKANSCSDSTILTRCLSFGALKQAGQLSPMIGSPESSANLEVTDSRRRMRGRITLRSPSATL